MPGASLVLPCDWRVEMAAALELTPEAPLQTAASFTCNGRGENLFGRAGHDAELVHDLTGSRATAGMFCAGEFGPVAGANHVHGFTASSLLFAP